MLSYHVCEPTIMKVRYIEGARWVVLRARSDVNRNCDVLEVIEKGGLRRTCQSAVRHFGHKIPEIKMLMVGARIDKLIAQL
jgi:hypothetical protein